MAPTSCRLLRCARPFPRPATRDRFPWLGALAALLLAGACGGDGGGPSEPQIDDTPATVSLSSTLDTLSFVTATRQLNATVKNQGGSVISPAVAWSSTLSGVATVSQSGLVTAVGPGNTEIIAQAGTASARATILVYQDPSSIAKVSGDGQSGVMGELDAYATPATEAALMTRMMQSNRVGFATIEDATGIQIGQFLSQFYSALWAGGRVYHARLMQSWNLYDIVSRFGSNAQLTPRRVTDGAPQASVRVRGGSSAYLHWVPAGAVAPTSIKFTDPAGSVPEGISLWLLRLR